MPELAETVEQFSAWAALARPFRADQLEHRPVDTQKGADAKKYACKKGSLATRDGLVCGGYHAPAMHLTYVGHAGVTMRLLEVDPSWSWEPQARTQYGTPLIVDGGMWINLTVLGVTRPGFGDAGGRSGPNATKEIIGDAIRNAAMRFGVGTYLWSKSEEAEQLTNGPDAAPAASVPSITPEAIARVRELAGQKGMPDDQLLAGAAYIAGRQIEELEHLTAPEGQRLVARLVSLQAGA